MHSDTVVYERSVYTMWDWLGDIGGLFGTLHILGGYIISIISYLTGSSAARSLIGNLF